MIETMTGQVLSWYAALIVISIVWLPLTRVVFRPFRDGGWLFARAMGILFCAAGLWSLNVMRVIPFTREAAFGAVGAALVLNLAVAFTRKRAAGREDQVDRRLVLAEVRVDRRLVLAEELIFLAIFLTALWLIGFRPEAYGTEKPMDFAFITAMLRGTKMPFADPWYGGEPINYYYGGQYVTAFLIRVSGVTAGYGYNLMRATITAFSFCLPFSIVREAVRRYFGRDAQQASRKTGAASLAGILAGIAVGFAGNGHYLIYGIILSIKEKLMPGSVMPLPDYPDKPYFYWFPDSTRYIGYYPDAPDKTIHEFPAYSSILGDLHAHYIDLVFTILLAGLLYAFLIRREETRLKSDPSLGQLLREALLDPCVILAGLMIGLFKWTNYWDYPIYMVVGGAVIFFGQLRKYRLDPVRFFVNIILQAAEIYVLGTLAALPFTSTFDMIASEVKAVHSHTPLYQLAVLWGIPAVAVVLLFLMIMRRFHREDILEYDDEQDEALIHRPHGFMRLLATIAPEDLVMLIFGVCALGLVLLPELIYVRDIYEGEHYRANTMFKLTYQAFILFGLSMSYTAVRALRMRRHEEPTATAADHAAPSPGAEETAASGAVAPAPRTDRSGFYRVAGGIMTVLILILGTFTISSSITWFSPASSPWHEPDASLFVSTYYPTDAGGINWLNSHIDGQPVVLESPGDSYSDHGRVSEATGLPTVLGWYVHEWLWRSDPDELKTRTADIETIYTSDDAEAVRQLIRKYHISYIYIGKLEREKYGFVNDALLQSLGEVAYSDGVNTYIMRVDA